MKRETRIKILNKLAKSDRKLQGRMGRKELEKYLSDSKKIYEKSTSELNAVESMILKLKGKYESLKEQQSFSKDEMGICHRLLQNMDFSNAREVRLGKDKEDVAYNVDGKWCSYSDETGLSKYEKKKKEEKQDSDDVNDADDVNNVIEKLVEIEDGIDQDELMEGIDVTK